MKFLSVFTEETFTLVKFTNGKMFDEASISELGLELLVFVETTLEKKKSNFRFHWCCLFFKCSTWQNDHNE